MGDSQGIDEQVEAAWNGFRARLADRLEQLGQDDWLRIEAETIGEDGATPFVQFAAFGDDIRAEAGGMVLLPPPLRPRLDVRWTEPLGGEPYLHTDLPRRDVERLAFEAVHLLRELIGVTHPSFLDADGLEIDPDHIVAAETTSEPSSDFVEPDVEPMTFAMSRDHLREAVDLTLQGMLKTNEVQYDEDEDAPIRCGESLVFVRVCSDRPSVEVFAEIVLGAADEDRVAMEVGLLNESHPYAKFFVRGEVIVMQWVHPAVPFVPVQFRTMTEAFLNEVDNVARRLAKRVDGRRFFEPEPEDAPEPTLADLYPGIAMMLELMPTHHLTSARMAALFEHNQYLVLEAIQVVRDGIVDIGDEDPELVIMLLRKGLRVIVDAEANRHRTAKKLPPNPRRSRQETLLADGEVGIETLDLDRSA